MRTEFAVKDDGVIICTINTVHHFSIGDYIDDRATGDLYTVAGIFYVLGSGLMERRIVEIEVAK